MKKIVCIVLAVLMALSLAACAGKKPAEEASTGDAASGNLMKITFCLDWTPNTNHTGLYVAKARGLFEKAGLDVTIVQPPQAGAVQACASGQAQFSIDAQDTLAPALVSDTPIGVTAVAAILQHNTSGIMSSKGQGMDRPAGIAGKTYLTWNSPTELAIMQHVVETDGGDWSKVSVIPNTVTEEAQDVRQNPDHAIWVFYGWGGVNAEVSKIPVDFFFFKDIDAVFDYYTPVIIANDAFLKEQPDAAKAFLAAAAEGYAWAAAHPEEAAQILIDGDETGSLVGSEDLVVASQKWISAQYTADAQAWGRIDPARWDGFYAWLFENGLIEKELPAGTGFTNDFLP